MESPSSPGMLISRMAISTGRSDASAQNSSAEAQVDTHLQRRKNNNAKKD